MKFYDFVQQTERFPIINKALLVTLPGSLESHRLQLSRWSQSSKIISLKRGLYTLPENQQKTNFSLRWLANFLYSPSYLSLEYVLSWHDMIPERVLAITSVSRLKTACFINKLGTFSYRHLKKELFFGFHEVPDEYNRVILMADPEKALLDFIYLCHSWKPTRDFVEHNLRLQQLDQLKRKKLKEYARSFNMPKMKKAVELILSLI